MAGLRRVVWEGLLEEASSELGPEGRTGGRGHGDPGLWSAGTRPGLHLGPRLGDS